MVCPCGSWLPAERGTGCGGLGRPATDGDAYPDRYSDRDAYSDRYSDRDAYSDRYPYRDSDGYANCHTDCDADSDAKNSHTNRYANCYTDRDTHGYADPDPMTPTPT